MLQHTSVFNLPLSWGWCWVVGGRMQVSSSYANEETVFASSEKNRLKDCLIGT